jgi:hypothetical protein
MSLVQTSKQSELLRRTSNVDWESRQLKRKRGNVNWLSLTVALKDLVWWSNQPKRRY